MAQTNAPGAVPARPPAVSGSLRQRMAQHPLIAYTVMAYAFSWIMTIPYILWEWGRLPGTANQYALVFVVKAYAGPFLAAYIMSRITGGKEGWRRLRRRIFQWREGWQWYAFILLVFPAFLVLAILLMPGAVASFTGVTLRDVITLVISFVIITLGGGPLAEEPGWRGYALPLLQSRYASSRYAALKASLVLGVMWTFWHLPDFLTSAQHGGPAAGLKPFYANLPIFFVMVMFLTIIFTWVSNHTQGSVFMAILLHAVVNTLGGTLVALFPVPAVTESELSMLIGWGTLALLILVLTRGKLGYQLSEPDGANQKAAPLPGQAKSEGLDFRAPGA